MSDGTEGGHLDFETLADYGEGVLDAQRSEVVRAHLAACTQCRARGERLTEVSRLLAESPAPTMPEDVAANIDASIARAERERTVVPLGRARRRRSLWIGSAAAAIVALVVIGGVLGGVRGPVPLSGSAGSEGGSAGSVARGDAAHAPQEGRSTRPPARTAVAASVTASGRDYTARRLSSQVSGLLRRRRNKAGVELQRGQHVPPRLRSLAEPRKITACVSSVTGAGAGHLLVVDLATYEGKPSAIIVVDTQPRPGAEVWVVGPSCESVRAHTALHPGKW